MSTEKQKILHAVSNLTRARGNQEMLEDLELLYTAFVYDSISASLNHEIRVHVYDTYRDFELFLRALPE